MRVNILPNSFESEQSLIGGMLANPDIIPLVFVKIDTDDIYYDKHKVIFEAIKKAPNKDPVTIWNEVDKTKADKRYYMELMCVTTASAWEYHCEIIKKASNKRKLWSIGTELREQAALEHTEYPELISTVKNQLISIEKLTETDDYDNANHYMKLYNSMGEVKEPGLYSGLFDAKFYFERGYIHCIAAESGVGKSALALKIAYKMASSYGNIDYYSFESTRDRLSNRQIARLAKVSLTRINRNNFTDSGQELQIQNAILSACDSSLYFFDNPKYMEIERLISHAESRALKYKTAAIFVDYLQMAQSLHRKISDRKGLVENALFKLKALAKNLNIPVIYISQLRKDIEGAPDLDDLYESNAIRQATDNIIFIWSPESIEKRQDKPVYPVKIYASKCKDQNLFFDWFEFNGHFQDFTRCEEPTYLLVKKNKRTMRI